MPACPLPAATGRGTTCEPWQPPGLCPRGEGRRARHTQLLLLRSDRCLQRHTACTRRRRMPLQGLRERNWTSTHYRPDAEKWSLQFFQARKAGSCAAPRAALKARHYLPPAPWRPRACSLAAPSPAAPARPSCQQRTPAAHPPPLPRRTLAASCGPPLRGTACWSPRPRGSSAGEQDCPLRAGRHVACHGPPTKDRRPGAGPATGRVRMRPPSQGTPAPAAVRATREGAHACGPPWGFPMAAAPVAVAPPQGEPQLPGPAHLPARLLRGGRRGRHPHRQAGEPGAAPPGAGGPQPADRAA